MMRPLFVFSLSAIFVMALSLPPQLQLKDKVVIIDFFASWCQSCRKELPILQQFAKEHPKIKIVAVNVDEDKKMAKKFVKKIHLQLPVIYDTKGEIINQFNPVGIPAIYIFKDGKFHQSIIGAKSDLKKSLLEAIR